MYSWGHYYAPHVVKSHCFQSASSSLSSSVSNLSSSSSVQGLLAWAFPFRSHIYIWIQLLGFVPGTLVILNRDAIFQKDQEVCLADCTIMSDVSGPEEEAVVSPDHPNLPAAWHGHMVWGGKEDHPYQLFHAARPQTGKPLSTRIWSSNAETRAGRPGCSWCWLQGAIQHSQSGRCSQLWELEERWWRRLLADWRQIEAAAAAAESLLAVEQEGGVWQGARRGWMVVTDHHATPAYWQRLRFRVQKRHDSQTPADDIWNRTWGWIHQPTHVTEKTNVNEWTAMKHHGD